MFVDARELVDGAEFRCDLCIVGAGAAGITMARELRNRGLRVIVLESGGFEPDTAVQDLYRGEVVDPFYEALDTTRLRFFGGTTNHWAGYCRILDEIDFRRRDGFPYSGWPFSRADLVPYYRRAHPVAGLGPYDDDVAARAKSDGEQIFQFDPARIVEGLYHVSAPLRFGPAYRQDLAMADDVAVHLNANLVDVETDDGARHVSGLVVGCLTGSRYRIRPRVVVLATGGVENARLLLNMDSVQADGLGNGNGLVGRFFMDHPLIFETADLIPADPYMRVAIYGDYVDDRGTVRAVTTLAEALISHERLPNVVVTWSLTRDFADGDHSASTIYRALKAGTLPDEFGTHLGRALADIDDVAATAYRKVMGQPTRLLKLTAHCRVEPVPDPDSRVTLQAARDSLGLRRPRLDWRPSTDGARALRRIHELLALEAGRTGLGRLKIRIPMAGPDWPSRMAPSNHHIGTTRMADDPAHGVVDRDSRVHGIDNLYVAGSSVFPAAGPNNPTLTIVALALRLADHLQARLVG